MPNIKISPLQKIYNRVEGPVTLPHCHTADRGYVASAVPPHQTPQHVTPSISPHTLLQASNAPSTHPVHTQLVAEPISVSNDNILTDDSDEEEIPTHANDISYTGMPVHHNPVVHAQEGPNNGKGLHVALSSNTDSINQNPQAQPNGFLNRHAKVPLTPTSPVPLPKTSLPKQIQRIVLFKESIIIRK